MNDSERRALVLTALPVEYNAVRRYLKNLHEEEDAVGTVYEVGTFAATEFPWTVCLAEVGAGNIGAATHVERALLHFRPSVALFVGIAGGVKDVAIGDVVVATKIYGYESGKETGGGFLPRPDVGNSAYRLIQRARAEARGNLWHKRLGTVGHSSSPRAFVGPIAAGEKVIATAGSVTAEFLRDHYGDALAVEMEGAGFLRALHAHTDTAALVVRGISDLLSGKADADRSGSQHVASTNAAAFAMSVLERLGTASGAYKLPSSQKRTRVFLSYSHDSPEHDARVRDIAQQLRADGIDCRIDVLERGTPTEGWPLWMERQISQSDFVLAVCTKTFSRRFAGEDTPDAGLGAAWESQITSQTLRTTIPAPDRVVPILLDDASVRDLPSMLRPLVPVRLPSEYEALLRRLTGEGSVPPLGSTRRPQPSVPRDDRPRKQSGARVFISYSHRDEAFREELTNHLAVLRRQGVIELWHDRSIAPGADWAGEIDNALVTADIFIALVSADFLASDYCYDKEFAEALNRHRLGLLRVIPIIVRPCDWSASPIGALQALPRDARPVSAWTNADDAWLDVARALRTLATRDAAKAVKIERGLPAVAPPVQTAAIVRPIELIFPRGGIPELNYVTPHRFNYLKVYLRDPNGGVVVEGPSGIGKTTATRKALDELKVGDGARHWFRAGRPDEVGSLRSLLDTPPNGVVVVDDFHHLPAEMKTGLARAIKYACDATSGPKTKFVLIGINKVGYALLDTFPDLHGRVVTFPMGRQPADKIGELISLGEAAANIRLLRKDEIILEAAGSFFMAQQLCFFAAMAAGVECTQSPLKDIEQSVADITPDILEYQRLKFHKPVTDFACFDSGVDQRGACLALLHRIAFDSDGCVLVEDVRRQYPNLDASFSWLYGDGVAHHDQAAAMLAGLFHFDPVAGVFSVEDPQLQFYMKHLEWTAVAKQAGIKARITPDGWLHVEPHASAGGLWSRGDA